MKVIAVNRPEQFKPYKIEITIETREEHETLRYASMCTNVLPDALKKKANESTSLLYQGQAKVFHQVYKNFLTAVRYATQYMP